MITVNGTNVGHAVEYLKASNLAMVSTNRAKVLDENTVKIYPTDSIFRPRHFFNTQQPLELGHGLNRFNGNYEAKTGKYFHLAVSSPLIFFGFLGICGVLLIVFDRRRLEERDISGEDIQMESFENSEDEEARDNQFRLEKQYSPLEMVIIDLPSLHNLEASPESISSSEHIKSPMTSEAFGYIIFLKRVLKTIMALFSDRMQPKADLPINMKTERNFGETLNVRSLNKTLENIKKSNVIANGMECQDTRKSVKVGHCQIFKTNFSDELQEQGQVYI